jgi:hypothetical protein
MIESQVARKEFGRGVGSPRQFDTNKGYHHVANQSRRAFASQCS